MKYRADIDGLRALAVIPVLFYHVGVPGFPGGFVGVDIFFVISGYLICGMIDGEIRSGSFSLGNFYKRRILRILPALFVMLLATCVLAYACCLPVELEDYSKSLASAVGSVSNVYFAQTAGYFDAPAETKPLLHTWSLGVEEQFYLIAPLLMLFAYSVLRKRARLLFAAAAALSLAAAFAVSYRNTTFVFYLTPFRAWELALGALLSIGFIPVPETAFGKNACGVIGMLLLVGAILLGSSSAPLLLMTSLASVGAALVIASSERGTSAVRNAAVAAAGRFRRPDFLFAVFVALAADRLSTNGRIVFPGLLRRGDKTVADRRLDRRRLAVMEICRNTVSIEGQG